jgi:DNA polymerase I-like protein with 3'-5' exonuclease and polymerase domains
MPDSPQSTTTSCKPTDAINCDLCNENPNAWNGPDCGKCPYKGKEHYVEPTQVNADYYVITDAPEPPGPSAALKSHEAWSTAVERIVVRAFANAKNSGALSMTGQYLYAVHCAVKKPKKKALDCCKPILYKHLLTGDKSKPKMVFALGTQSLKALGIKFQKHKDVQDRLMEVQLGGYTLYVYASVSTRQLQAKGGFYEILTQHIGHFLKAVVDVHNGKELQVVTPLAELTKDYIYPKTLSEVRELVQEIINYSRPGRPPETHLISIDTETNTLKPHLPSLKLLTLVVAWDVGKAASIPVEHPESLWTLEDVRVYLAQLLNSRKYKAFHNANYDLKVLHNKGFSVQGFMWDTLLAEHILSEDKQGNYSLKDLTATQIPKYASYEDTLHASLTDDVEDNGFESVPLETLNMYGAIDADVTRQLAVLQRKRMREEDTKLQALRNKLSKHRAFMGIATRMTNNAEPLATLLWNVSLPAVHTLSRMENHGIAVDRNYLRKVTQDVAEDAMECSIQLRQMTRMFKQEEFNPNSHHQIAKILFAHGYTHPETGKLVCYKDILPEEEIPRTETGLISMNAAFLGRLVNDYDCRLSEALLTYRKLSKAQDTYLKNMYKRSEDDGRMHTSFHLTGTVTGRLSSSRENMQNIPHKLGDHNIKKVFIPTSPDKVLINADAKAAEVRIYAAYSKDPNLVKALNDGMDPHSFFASVVYSPENALKDAKNLAEKTRIVSAMGIDMDHPWAYEDFQDPGKYKDADPAYKDNLIKLRKNIKRVVFGILYGAGKKNIAGIVGISSEQAAAIIDVLFKMFPTIPAYIRQTQSQVEHLGIVETYLGRRRRFNMQGMTHFQKSRANRQAVNFKIQSTSSDIVMDVLARVDNTIQSMGGQMLLTVHDSLVFELPFNKLGQIPDLIEEYGVREVARKYPWLPVPFHWDIEAGPSYGELSPLGSNLKLDSDDDVEDVRSIIEETA